MYIPGKLLRNGLVLRVPPWKGLVRETSAFACPERVILFRPRRLSRGGAIRVCALSSDARNVEASEFSLTAEIQQAKREARPYKINRASLTAVEREELRLRSKAIPMKADKEPLEVVFEDSRFLVVNKPSFLKMHPSHRFEGGSLLNRAIGHCGFAPHMLHRLDMHTTGVVVMAKKKELCTPIMRQFMAGEVKKEYLCIVDGICGRNVGESFTVDAPIQRHDTVRFLREVGASKEDSKPAQTLYTVLDKSWNKEMSLLRAAPQTGKTHQIRLHAKECSLPIVGDDLYNPKEHDLYASYEEISAAAKDGSLSMFADSNPLRKGLKLHAWRIMLKDPENDNTMLFCAPPPAHMQQLLIWAGLNVPTT